MLKILNTLYWNDLYCLLNLYLSGHYLFILFSLITYLGICLDTRFLLRNKIFIGFYLLIIHLFLVLYNNWDFWLLKDIYWYTLILNGSFAFHVLYLNWIYRYYWNKRDDYKCFLISQLSFYLSLSFLAYLMKRLKMYTDKYRNMYLEFFILIIWKILNVFINYFHRYSLFLQGKDWNGEKAKFQFKNLVISFIFFLITYILAYYLFGIARVIIVWLIIFNIRIIDDFFWWKNYKILYDKENYNKNMNIFIFLKNYLKLSIILGQLINSCYSQHYPRYLYFPGFIYNLYYYRLYRSFGYSEEDDFCEYEKASKYYPAPIYKYFTWVDLMTYEAYKDYLCTKEWFSDWKLEEAVQHSYNITIECFGGEFNLTEEMKFEIWLKLNDWCFSCSKKIEKEKESTGIFLRKDGVYVQKRFYSTKKSLKLKVTELLQAGTALSVANKNNKIPKNHQILSQQKRDIYLNASSNPGKAVDKHPIFILGKCLYNGELYAIGVQVTHSPPIFKKVSGGAKPIYYYSFYKNGMSGGFGQFVGEDGRTRYYSEEVLVLAKETDLAKSSPLYEKVEFVQYSENISKILKNNNEIVGRIFFGVDKITGEAIYIDVPMGQFSKNIPDKDTLVNLNFDRSFVSKQKIIDLSPIDPTKE